MTILSVSKFVTDSIEEGYAKTGKEATAVLMRVAGESFVSKLVAAGVAALDGPSDIFIGMCQKYDSLIIFFRGKFFETHINIELLEAGLDHHVFVLVTDKDKLDAYQAVVNKYGHPKKEVTQYNQVRPAKELLN